MGKIWAHMASVYCPSSDFCVSVFVWISMVLQITVLILNYGHMDSYFTHKYRRMNGAYSFYCKIHVGFQNHKKIDFQMFVIHLNHQTLKTYFSLILLIKMIFKINLGCIHFFSSTCGQNISVYGQILLPKQGL